MTQTIKITQEEFQSKVLESNKTVLVDFYADWCGPCKALAPVLDEVAAEFEETTTVVKVDVDKSAELAQKYGIRGMPTMLFIKDGKVKGTLVGNQPKAAIIKAISEIS